MKSPVRITRLGLACVVALAAGLASAPPCSADTVLGGVDLGSLPEYMFAFVGNANGSGAFNLQGATDGYQGNIAVNANPTASDLRTSGSVPYQGTMITNSATLGAWQTGIIRDNNVGGSFPFNNAVGITGQSSLIAGLQSDLTSAMTQIGALPVTPGFASVSSTSLNGLDVTNNPNKVFVINITSGLSVSTKINITGNADDIFILRWSTTPGSPNYTGQVKFSGGGGIVPLGGLTPTNFINVAGDINSSGGGTTPLPPYPQGVPIQGGSLFGGGGFFTGYWLTTGDPVTRETANAPGDTGSLSNAIFTGGWYTSTTQFSLTSGSSGVFVPPPLIEEAPLPGVPEPSSVILVGFGIATVGLIAWRRRRRVAA